MALPAGTDVTPAETPRRPIVTLWLLRILLVLHLLLAVSQPLTIGRYLDGAFSMVQVHAVLGSVLFLTTVVAVVAAIGYAVAGGRFWVAPVLAVVTFVEMVQVGVGYSRLLGIHVPVGVGIVVAAVLICWWSWTAGARRGRPRRDAKPRERVSEDDQVPTGART